MVAARLSKFFGLNSQAFQPDIKAARALPKEELWELVSKGLYNLDIKPALEPKDPLAFGLRLPLDTQFQSFFNRNCWAHTAYAFDLAPAEQKAVESAVKLAVYEEIHARRNMEGKPSFGNLRDEAFEDVPYLVYDMLKDRSSLFSAGLNDGQPPMFSSDQLVDFMDNIKDGTLRPDYVAPEPRSNAQNVAIDAYLTKLANVIEAAGYYDDLTLDQITDESLAALRKTFAEDKDVLEKSRAGAAPLDIAI